MTQIPLIMPQLGESIAEAKVIRILVHEGDQVAGDQDVMEVETNKAVMNMVSPCPGRVLKILAVAEQSYPVGAVLGYLEASKADVTRLGLNSGAPNPASTITGQENGIGTELLAGPQAVEPRVRGLPVPAHAAGAGYMSPRMRARMHELGLHEADLSAVAGSGAGGRVTIEDFENYLAYLEKNKMSPASPMRVAVADAMRRSWTRPLATVALPVQMDAVLAHRNSCNPKPGPTVYALRALGLALAENTTPAGRLVGTRIVHPSSIDLGFAVEADDGVLVPVIRAADKCGFQAMMARYQVLVDLARKRQVPSDAVGGSIATVTNYGTFGLTWATPIPLPEQTLVLGMGAARRQPHWDEKLGQFVPVMEANLTLSFDHRVLDGGAAGRLLTRIVQLMMKPETL
jgi:pyruvate/2-oxoglutarate dehydrogenase complex dihydrolipoamide acyltransferase (E2) component